jgi:hypothetical protein
MLSINGNCVWARVKFHGVDDMALNSLSSPQQARTNICRFLAHLHICRNRDPDRSTSAQSHENSTYVVLSMSALSRRTSAHDSFPMSTAKPLLALDESETGPQADCRSCPLSVLCATPSENFCTTRAFSILFLPASCKR